MHVALPMVRAVLVVVCARTHKGQGCRAGVQGRGAGQGCRAGVQVLDRSENHSHVDYLVGVGYLGGQGTGPGKAPGNCPLTGAREYELNTPEIQRRLKRKDQVRGK
jgi:hypothetical protein